MTRFDTYMKMLFSRLPVPEPGVEAREKTRDATLAEFHRLGRETGVPFSTGDGCLQTTPIPTRRSTV